jgi:hypothetical protein
MNSQTAARLKRKIAYVALDANDPAQGFAGEGKIEEASGEVVASSRAALAVRDWS